MFLRAGIPSVIAMQEKISVGAARFFTETFYRQLTGEGYIDAAVVAARRKVKNEGTATNPEWYYPVLYMQSDDPRLFDRAGELAQRLETHLEELESLQIRYGNLEREQDLLNIKIHYLRDRSTGTGLSNEELVILDKRRVRTEKRQALVKDEMITVEDEEIDLVTAIEAIQAELDALNGQDPLYSDPTLYRLATRLSFAFRDDLGRLATEFFGIEFSDKAVADSASADGQALSLVKYLYNRGQLDRLLRIARSRFPDVEW
jgi:hypothetical protein